MPVKAIAIQRDAGLMPTEPKDLNDHSLVVYEGSRITVKAVAANVITRRDSNVRGLPVSAFRRGGHTAGW